MAETAGNRFGEIVVRENFASRAAVQECLEIQEKLRSFGVEPKRLGEIMAEKGYLTDANIQTILEMQQTQGSRIESRSRSAAALHAEDDFQPPSQLAGYEIGELLGRGGMGAVYKACQTSLDRTVAIKILPPRTAKNRRFIERFISEARTVARLNHKNIIAGIDVGEDKGFYYFVMEYVEGESLDKLITADGVLEEAFALEVMTQIGRALEHAEKHNLVHRDVKPQNILIDKNNQAKLCDLGLAKTQNELGGGGSGDTRNAPLGTPHYLSPEQAKGEELDIRSDIYSLGATFFHMVTGRPPFDGQSAMVLMTKHLTEVPESPKRLNPKLSKGCCDLILGMLEKDPEGRPQTPRDLLEDIERVQTGKKPRASGRSARRPKAAKAKPVSNGSATKARRGRRPDAAARMPSADDARRRRRAATIRSVRKNENAFLAIFVVTVVLLVATFIYFIYVKPPTISVAPPSTPEQDEEAQRALIYARRFEHENPTNQKDAASLYRQIIDRYPGTPSAQTARVRLNELSR